MLETDSSLNPQNCFFLDLLCCFKFQEKIADALHRVKSHPKKNGRNLRNPKQFVESTNNGIVITL